LELGRRVPRMQGTSCAKRPSYASRGIPGRVSRVRTYVLDPTDVNTYSDANTSTTDVLVHDGYYSTLCGLTWFHPSTGSGVVGLAICGSLPGSACEQFRVYYNQYFTDIADLTDVRGLATHEAGHTLGLLHRTGNTAMQTGYPKPCLCFDPNHEVLHLNSNY